jgi:hypothetical protein
MTTLSPTKARAKLSHWLKLAAAGEDIGIQCGESVIVLRPLTPGLDDGAYAKGEYGVTAVELAATAKRVKSELARDRREGRMKRYAGDFHAAIGD